jgi:ATP-binding cassette subfamily B protein
VTQTYAAHSGEGEKEFLPAVQAWAGKLIADRLDFQEYDLPSLHQRVGVIFQDFVQFHLTVRENIGFGQVEALEDRSREVRAAQKGGAHPIIERLPEGYEAWLGRRWGKGYELSGGEWQKIALSRVFMRDDEVFQRFGELTEGRLAVRMADRIVVIEGGHITEVGGHQELLTRGGTYSRLFNLQAEGYR